jgi:hypothetical protein
MFERNTLTFNPGCGQDAQNVDPFTDVRDIQRRLKASGLTFVQKAGRRVVARSRELHRDRPRRQPRPVRPASLSRVMD